MTWIDFSKENILMANNRAQYHQLSGKCKWKQWDITCQNSYHKKKNTNNKSWWGCGEKGTRQHCCRNVNWYSHFGKQYSSSSKIKIKQAIPLLGIYLKKTKTLIQKDVSTHPVFTAALFTVVKIWKQPGCPSKVEWIKNMWYLYRASQVALVVKNPSANTGTIRDEGSIPGSGRSPGRGRGNSLQ